MSLLEVVGVALEVLLRYYVFQTKGLHHSLGVIVTIEMDISLRYP